MMLLAAFPLYDFLFMLFAIMACGFAVGVLFSTNIVRMAFYLVISLGSTAGLFFLAGAEFVGAMQLMIYVGGTMVLLIFGVMLTAQERFISLQASGRDWILGLIAGSALLLLLLKTRLPQCPRRRPSNKLCGPGRCPWGRWVCTTLARRAWHRIGHRWPPWLCCGRRPGRPSVPAPGSTRGSCCPRHT